MTQQYIAMEAARERAFEWARQGGGKAEARIVALVSQHDCGLPIAVPRQGEPGAHQRVQVRVDARAFRTWDTALPGWVTPAGTYPIRVGRSSGDLRLAVDLDLPGSPSAGPDPHL